LNREAPDDASHLIGTIARATYLGEVTRYHLTCGEAQLLVVTEQNRAAVLR